MDSFIPTSSLAKHLGIDSSMLFNLFIKNGWLKNKNILTDKGKKNGGKYKSGLYGKTYPIWHKNLIQNEAFKTEILEEINGIKKEIELKNADLIDCISTTSLARKLGIEIVVLFDLLIQKGWLENSKTLTDKGKKFGGRYKSALNNKTYPVWHENLMENEVFKIEILSEIKTNDRVFKLPDFQDLSKEQDNIINLPLNGRYLIIGGPGTGKSVIALLMAIKSLQNKEQVIFLTYNKVLQALSKQLFSTSNKKNSDTAIKVDSSGTLTEFDEIFITLDKWIKDLANKYLSLEELEDLKSNKGSFIDSNKYEALLNIFNKKGIKDLDDYKKDIVIIDEAQDKPKSFYEIITNIGYDNFIIFADQNQQITDLNSNIEELQEAFSILKEEIFHLTQNYRNSEQIAKFANCFYVDKTSKLPAIPDKKSIYSPILYDYEEIEDIATFILKEYDQNPNLSIGVIVWNIDILYKIQEILNIQKDAINLDNKHCKISSYCSKDRKVSINFMVDNIIILNSASAKGTEFDTVFVLLDEFKKTKNRDLIKKKFYVISTRARKKLFFMNNIKNPSDVLEIFPQDERLLKRKQLLFKD